MKLSCECVLHLLCLELISFALFAHVLLRLDREKARTLEIHPQPRQRRRCLPEHQRQLRKTVHVREEDWSRAVRSQSFVCVCVFYH